VYPFAPHSTDCRSRKWTHYGVCKNIALVVGVTALVNVVAALINVVTALVNIVAALVNGVAALVNGVVVLINGVAALVNGSTVIVNVAALVKETIIKNSNMILHVFKCQLSYHSSFLMALVRLLVNLSLLGHLSTMPRRSVVTQRATVAGHCLRHKRFFIVNRQCPSNPPSGLGMQPLPVPSASLSTPFAFSPKAKMFVLTTNTHFTYAFSSFEGLPTKLWFARQANTD